MRTATRDDLDGETMAPVLHAIAAIMESETICAGGEAVLVRVIQRDAEIDLDDDHVIYVVREAWAHGQDATGALSRLRALSDAGQDHGGVHPR